MESDRTESRSRVDLPLDHINLSFPPSLLASFSLSPSTFHPFPPPQSVHPHPLFAFSHPPRLSKIKDTFRSGLDPALLATLLFFFFASFSLTRFFFYVNIFDSDVFCLYPLTHSSTRTHPHVFPRLFIFFPPVRLLYPSPFISLPYPGPILALPLPLVDPRRPASHYLP